MPNPDFVGLIFSVQSTAEAALGDINAMTSTANRDGILDVSRARQAAERSLKLLKMLAEKTKGNLDFEEAQLLSDAIMQLQQRLDDVSEESEGAQT